MEAGTIRLIDDTTNEEFFIKLPKDIVDNLKEFNENYLLESEISGSQIITLGQKIKKEEQYCRFCLETYPKVTFKNEAHVLPQMMNKSKPKSNFECDTCNEKFSLYESDLGSYSLLERAFLGYKKKKGYPKFKSFQGAEIHLLRDLNHIKSDKISKDDLELTKLSLDDENRILTMVKQDNLGKEIIKTDKGIKIEIPRPPYRPFNIYKAFIKIALSLLKENEIKSYSLIRKILQDEKFEISPEMEGIQDEIMMSVYEIQEIKQIFESPTARIYRKQTKDEEYVEKLLVLYFGNRIYQIPIPTDKNLFNLQELGKSLRFIKISPLLNPLYSLEMFKMEQLVKSLCNVKVKDINLCRTRLVKDDTIEYNLIHKK